MSDWHFGRLDAASAVLANGRLVVQVEGVRPGRHFDVMLAAYTPDPDSTADVQMGLYWRARSPEDGGEPTPYTVRTEAALPDGRTAVVRVYHASGYVDLRVGNRPSTPGLRVVQPPRGDKG